MMLPPSSCLLALSLYLLSLALTLVVVAVLLFLCVSGYYAARNCCRTVNVRSPTQSVSTSRRRRFSSVMRGGILLAAWSSGPSSDRIGVGQCWPNSNTLNVDKKHNTGSTNKTEFENNSHTGGKSGVLTGKTTSAQLRSPNVMLRRHNTMHSFAERLSGIVCVVCVFVRSTH